MDKVLKILFWVVAILATIGIIILLVNRNRNGKTTTTQINPDGTKTVTTTFADGSRNVATYNSNGGLMDVQRKTSPYWVGHSGPGGSGGKQLINCCTARNAACQCTASSWVPREDCNDPGCGGSARTVVTYPTQQRA